MSSSSSSQSINVNVTVEAPPESTIKEITYDGQEIYQSPLTLSENLSNLIRKIDFSKANDATTPESEESSSNNNNSNKEEIASTSSASDMVPSVWLTASKKIREAINEVNCLIDLLNVTREKRYMVLDPVPQEPVEVKPLAQIYARKKGLTQAANMLLNAAERLRNYQNESSRNNSVTPDFHTELLRLRQNWRLKKVSDQIIGDLSYRTAGSKFQMTGFFEVTKVADHQITANSSGGSSDHRGAAAISGNSSSNSSGGNAMVQSSLNVIIPDELQGVAYIMVQCQKDDEVTFDTSVSLLQSSSGAPNADVHWQQKLEAAQNILFCKELFNLLAREAVQLQAVIPHLVIGNQIIGTVMPGIQLVITLCHSSGGIAEKKGSSSGSGGENISATKSNHDHVLEHSLHQLLREVHYRNMHPLLHPSSGPLGPSKKTYQARPLAADRYDLIEMAKSSTLLEKIIEQTQYYFMRSNAERVIDTIAKEVRDPTIVCHWNSLNAPSPACARILIVTPGFDALCRTAIMLHIMKNSFKCICTDGKVITLSYEPDELRDFIRYQLRNHQINGVQNIAKTMGWQSLTSCPYLGVGPAQSYTNASSTILVSPVGDRSIAVKYEPYGKVQVSVAYSPRKDFFCGQLIKERKWENLGCSFQEVRWENMEGKNFLNKMELLMASLTSSS